MPTDGAVLELLVGVMSYASPLAFARRELLRSMLRPDPAVAVRFVLARSALDADAGADVLPIAIAPNCTGRSLGTYLLNNGFFRYAVALRPAPRFIARADDDAFFDPPTVLAELRLLDGGFAYGQFKEWQMWDPGSMMGVCWSNTGAERWYKARQSLSGAGGTESSRAALPRHVRECLAPGLEGPFVFAKGPLVAYSLDVAAAIVALPRLASDEARAVYTRPTRTFVSPINGKALRPHSRLHPSALPLYDDVYFGALLQRAMGARDLTLLQANMDEWVKPPAAPAGARTADAAAAAGGAPLRLRISGHPPRIYHKLKQPRRLQWLNGSEAHLAALRRSRHAQHRQHVAVPRTLLRRVANVLLSRECDDCVD